MSEKILAGIVGGVIVALLILISSNYGSDHHHHNAHKDHINYDDCLIYNDIDIYEKCLDGPPNSDYVDPILATVDSDAYYAMDEAGRESYDRRGYCYLWPESSSCYAPTAKDWQDYYDTLSPVHKDQYTVVTNKLTKHWNEKCVLYMGFEVKCFRYKKGQVIIENG